MPFEDVKGPWPFGMDPLMYKLREILEKHQALGEFEQVVQAAIDMGLEDLRELEIDSPPKYVEFMSALLKWAPTERQDGKWVYIHICVFYFVFNLPPFGINTTVQTPIHPDSVGKPLAPVTRWLVDYAVQMGSWLSTTASWSEQQLATFKDAKGYNVQDYQGPWGTFNEFFARKLKVPRTIDHQDDDHYVVSPADCTYSTPLIDVDLNSDINVKGLLWNIDELLSQSDVLRNWKGVFAGGKFIHAFLAPYDYHRQHAPVAGDVIEAKVVQGQCYLQVVADETPDRNGRRRLVPVRPIPPPGQLDPEKPDAVDGIGYQFLQCRGIFLINTPHLGLVAVLPIGMAQVSSVKKSITADPTHPVPVTKGQEISWFEFGGSDIIMVFERRANPELLIDPEKNPHILQGTQVIKANYDTSQYK